MKDKALISIIIPVYNVEKYIDKCLDSIINQTYKNIEILIVDDGTKDNSGKICDGYAKNDKRIKVFHKENGGLSSARNYGIDKAKGDYLTFIDSDDTVELDYVETLYNLIVKYNTKMSIAPHNVVSNDKIIDFGKGYKEECLEQKEAIRRMLLEKGYSISSWCKMYKKELFNDVRFPEGKIYEDNATTYKLIMQCDKVSYSPHAIYNYFKREGTITTKKFSDSKLTFIEFSDAMGNDILKKYPDLEYAVENKKIDARFSILRQLNNDKKYDKLEKEIIKYIKSKSKLILKNKQTNRRTKIAIISLYLGKSFFNFSWNMYSKFRYQ